MALATQNSPTLQFPSTVDVFTSPSCLPPNDPLNHDGDATLDDEGKRSRSSITTGEAGCHALTNLLTAIPAPPINANKTPPNPADQTKPCPICKTPPVAAPAKIEFHGSSFCRAYTIVQSNAENKPPHTAKLPPTRGAFMNTDCVAPMRREPVGELHMDAFEEVEGGTPDGAHGVCASDVVDYSVRARLSCGFGCCHGEFPTMACDVRCVGG